MVWFRTVEVGDLLCFPDLRFIDEHFPGKPRGRRFVAWTGWQNTYCRRRKLRRIIAPGGGEKKRLTSI
jgi:hypothetical protein